MADETTQRKVHAFFLEKLRTLETFTKEDVRKATGWAETSADAYWSKQFKNIIEPAGDSTFRMRERFRLYTDWRKFKNLVTQVKTAPASYEPTVFDEVVVYEFYPHEVSGSACTGSAREHRDRGRQVQRQTFPSLTLAASRTVLASCHAAGPAQDC
ncbi:MAG: hypothetical protein GEV06_10135 [Luteitalea sp.]|nr:hypothetical protein [Luteitalea sp.]